jgi:ABC-type amino acid transport substrate-binding protein
MTTRHEAEERIGVWFLEEAPADVPDHVLVATFERTRTIRQDRRRIHAPRRVRSLVMLAAAFLVIGALLTAALAGSVLLRAPAPPRLDTDRILGNGVALRIAVDPGDPRSPAAGGFQEAVAHALADRLGVPATIVTITSDDLSASAADWDVAFPWAAASTLDPSRFAMTRPYLFWPHLVVVRATSVATSIDDIRGQPVCAVRDATVLTWLLGGGAGSPGNAGPPIASSLISRSTDDECFATLDAEAAMAVVTSSSSPADLARRPELRVIGRAPSDGRVVVTDSALSDAQLRDAVLGAISDLQADGTIARLATDRFGEDLTQAP